VVVVVFGFLCLCCGGIAGSGSRVYVVLWWS
jgi:hypothetical protein